MIFSLPLYFSYSSEGGSEILVTIKDTEQKKIPKYDKTSGAITRRFGRRSSTRTKLRLHYIPSKAALKTAFRSLDFK